MRPATRTALVSALPKPASCARGVLDRDGGHRQVAAAEGGLGHGRAGFHGNHGEGLIAHGQRDLAVLHHGGVGVDPVVTAHPDNGLLEGAGTEDRGPR